MKNLAGDLTADSHIRIELERARIEIVESGPVHGEVPATLQGKLGPITFTRAWYYWVADGPVPIETARELYADPVGRDDVRAGGHCGCPHPDAYGASYYDAAGVELFSDPDGKEQRALDGMVEKGFLKREEIIGRCVPDKKAEAVRVEVSCYHIDTEVGLRLFADTIRGLMRGPAMPAPTAETNELNSQTPRRELNMHFLTLVVIPEDGDVEKHVDAVMNSRKVKSALDWDWFQIGGRWTGLFSGYEADTDPKNIVKCDLCDGTGTRRDMVVANGCNGCAGKGERPVWPTERVLHAGDVLTTTEALANLTPERIPHAVAAKGVCSETESWNGKGFAKNPEHEATVRMALAQPGRCVVVDCHS